MNDEEIKAIKILKNIVLQEYDWWINKGDFAETNVKEANEAIKIILNLIEKQQKEIREIRSWKYTIDTIEDLEKLKELDLIKIKGKEYISKDRIREKIKELVNKNVEVLGADRYEYAVRVLQELLEDE